MPTAKQRQLINSREGEGILRACCRVRKHENVEEERSSVHEGQRSMFSDDLRSGELTDKS